MVFKSFGFILWLGEGKCFLDDYFLHESAASSPFLDCREVKCMATITASGRVEAWEHARCFLSPWIQRGRLPCCQKIVLKNHGSAGREQEQCHRVSVAGVSCSDVGVKYNECCFKTLVGGSLTSRHCSTAIWSPENMTDSLLALVDPMNWYDGNLSFVHIVS